MTGTNGGTVGPNCATMQEDGGGGTVTWDLGPRSRLPELSPTPPREGEGSWEGARPRRSRRKKWRPTRARAACAPRPSWPRGGGGPRRAWRR
eukprot:6465757-Pyramimonas_sp.AAC.1